MSDFLDELPEPFDPSAHKGTDDPIPIDWYSAHIVESNVRSAATGNGTYLRVVFEILDGGSRGRRIFQNITLQNTSQQAVEIGARLLKEIYESIGQTGPTRDISIMLCKPVMVRVGIKKDRDGIYADSNAVTSVKPPDYEPKRGGTSVPSKTPPVPPKGPVSPPASAAPASSGGSAPWRKIGSD